MMGPLSTNSIFDEVVSLIRLLAVQTRSQYDFRAFDTRPFQFVKSLKIRRSMAYTVCHAPILRHRRRKVKNIGGGGKV